ncbi:MAG: hypothetical protein ABI663_22450, partial [Chryseolinea sp.]
NLLGMPYVNVGRSPTFFTIECANIQKLFLRLTKLQEHFLHACTVKILTNLSLYNFHEAVGEDFGMATGGQYGYNPRWLWDYCQL